MMKSKRIEGFATARYKRPNRPRIIYETCGLEPSPPPVAAVVAGVVINGVVKPLYCDSPAARRRYGQALSASVNNPKSKLSKADRAELRRLAALWAATVKRAGNPTAKKRKLK